MKRWHRPEPPIVRQYKQSGKQVHTLYGILDANFNIVVEIQASPYMAEAEHVRLQVFNIPGAGETLVATFVRYKEINSTLCGRNLRCADPSSIETGRVAFWEAKAVTLSLKKKNINGRATRNSYYISI